MKKLTKIVSISYETEEEKQQAEETFNLIRSINGTEVLGGNQGEAGCQRESLKN